MAQSLICHLSIPTPLAFRPTIEIDFAQHSGFPRSSDDLLAWAKDAMISCSWPGAGPEKATQHFRARRRDLVLGSSVPSGGRMYSVPRDMTPHEL